MPVPLVARVEREYWSRSEGIRAAIAYVLDEAPLPYWSESTPEQSGLVAHQTQRVSVRVPGKQLDALETVVDQHPVDNRSQAIRDGLREVLQR
jgi:metal-responsive CopG/Arc/MetJ family transcriptional regulator